MMKHILAALAMFPLAVHANELSVGTFELSGDTALGFDTGKREVTSGTLSSTTDTTDYGLSAAGLYYVTPNVGIGLVLDYRNSKEKDAGFETGISTLMIGPALGLDFSVAPQVSVFARGMFGYASSTISETGSPDITPTGYGLGIQGGIKFFPAKNFSLDAGLGYNWLRLKESPVEVTTSGVAFDVGLSVYFGGN